MKYSVLIAVCVAAMGFAAVAEEADVKVAPKAPAAVVVTTNAVTGVVTTNAVKVTEIKKDAPKKVVE
jgi:hypothetical protein